MPCFKLFSFHPNKSKKTQAYEVLASKHSTYLDHSLFTEMGEFSHSLTDKENNQLTSFKSIESFVCLDSTDRAHPSMVNTEGHRYSLPIMSRETWRNFANSLAGEVAISFGFRKAWHRNVPAPMKHAVIFIKDEFDHLGVFGYNRLKVSKGNRISNEIDDKGISREYFLYDSLAIKGTAAQTQAMLESINASGLKMTFTAFTSNCYTPVISGLLRAEKMGFYVPEDYQARLLIVTSHEQNHGFGITSNHKLAPLVTEAAKNILTMR